MFIISSEKKRFIYVGKKLEGIIMVRKTIDVYLTPKKPSFLEQMLTCPRVKWNPPKSKIFTTPSLDEYNSEKPLNLGRILTNDDILTTYELVYNFFNDNYDNFKYDSISSNQEIYIEYFEIKDPYHVPIITITPRNKNSIVTDSIACKSNLLLDDMLNDAKNMSLFNWYNQLGFAPRKNIKILKQLNNILRKNPLTMGGIDGTLSDASKNIFVSAIPKELSASYKLLRE